MEAVKQGAATVAVKSKTHVVLCALKVILVREI
jgi:20S proteasome alpha/beta subunit